MSFSTDLRDALDQGDAETASKIFHHLHPYLPRPADRSGDEIVMHQARTAAESVRLEKRLYSHAWLSERNLQSGLPEELRPPSERRDGRIVRAVGVAYRTTSRCGDRREEAAAVERVMARVAGDMIRSGITDRARIAPEMWRARDAFLRGRLRRVWV